MSNTPKGFAFSPSTDNRNATGRLTMSKHTQDNGGASYLAEEAEKRVKKAKTKEMKPSEVRATQHWISPDGGGGDPVVWGLNKHPVVVKHQGEYHLVDGHHRMNAAAPSDRPVKTHVVNIDD